MRTAIRKEVTSFGTFLSTLCHEFFAIISTSLDSDSTIHGTLAGSTSDPSAGIRHLRCLRASAKAGFVLAVSHLALIMLATPDGSFAHDGHCWRNRSHDPFSEFCKG
jgi:hypothetical protein